MKTEHLRELAVLARHLNFTVAAKELFIAQSTLSSHMAALEEELGFALLKRKDDVRLTVAGSMFLEQAQLALDILDEASERSREVAAPPKPLRIAIQCPPPALAQMLKERLGVLFSFVSHDYQDPFFSIFTNDEADVLMNYDYRPFAALQREAERLGLTARTVAGAPASITVSTGNPLAKMDAPRREDLRGFTVVINSAPDYERWKTVVTHMLGADLGLSFRLDPVGDLSNLTFANYGNDLHVCGRELNDFYLLRRDDIATINAVEGVDLHIPQVVVHRADADEATLRSIDALCACWEEYCKQGGS